MRTLHIVRVFHPLEELGTVTQPFQRLEKLELGVEGAAMRRMQKAEEFILMAEKVVQMEVDHKKLFIFMDGFPAEQPEVEKFLYDNFVYKKRFPTYLFIDRLVRKGARLVGTESPELLREECQYVQEVTRVVETQELPEGKYAWLKSKAKDILERRDDFIAARIDSTLKDGDVGILFIGAMHHVEKRLPDDIQIIRL